MAKIIPLFSGSKGNCYYIGSGSDGILIDVGRSAKQICSALEEHGIKSDSPAGIFVTHEHSDHIKGVRVFAGKRCTPVYATAGTAGEMRRTGDANGVNLIELSADALRQYEPVCCAGFYVQPFATSHDAAESVGYKVTCADGTSICLATDLGIVTENVKKMMSACNAVIIESNHDVGMLKNGPYTYLLKRRILSDVGHLSNDACAQVLPELVKSGTTRIILSHLSEENNYPDLAYHTSLSILAENKMRANYDYTLNVAATVNDGTVIYL